MSDSSSSAGSMAFITSQQLWDAFEKLGRTLVLRRLAKRPGCLVRAEAATESTKQHTPDITARDVAVAMVEDWLNLLSVMLETHNDFALSYALVPDFHLISHMTNGGKLLRRTGAAELLDAEEVNVIRQAFAGWLLLEGEDLRLPGDIVLRVQPSPDVLFRVSRP